MRIAIIGAGLAGLACAIECERLGVVPFEADKLFSLFLKTEKLEHLEFFYIIKPPVFQTGNVSKLKIGNVLLTGRSGGLTERLIGEGASEAIISGVLSGRAMIHNLDYDILIKPYPDSEVKYQYDEQGNRTLMEDDNGTTTYDYDLLDKTFGYTGDEFLISCSRRRV